MRVTYHPEAESETIEAAKFYESRRTGLGGAFLDEVDDAVERLMDDPKRFPLIEDYVRRQFVRRFPCELYFRASGDEIRIMAVKHHSQAPGYWRSRR